MADEHDSEALAILRRVEPTLARIDDRLGGVEQRLARVEAILPTLATKEDTARIAGRLDAILPTLATKEAVAKLGYDLTWRFFAVLIGLLVSYLGAVWYVVTLTIRAHG
jgi:hypothetical protein